MEEGPRGRKDDPSGERRREYNKTNDANAANTYELLGLEIQTTLNGG